MAQKASASWVGLFREMDGNPAAQAAIRDLATKAFWPRLQQLGFTPRDGEAPLDSLLRAALIADLGYLGEPHVIAESRRLLAAWQRDPKAIPGSLKDSWLGVVARNADAPTWDVLHGIAAGTRGTVERSAYYQLLGFAKDDALARRALDLSITKEPGATVSAAIITAAAENHPVMAFDFVLSHLPQVDPLIDLSASSRFVSRLVQDSGDAAVVPKLRPMPPRTSSPRIGVPVDHAIARIRWRADSDPRIQREAVEWLKAHRAPAAG